MMKQLVRGLKSLFAGNEDRRPASRPRQTVRLCLERLEERDCPTTVITVDSLSSAINPNDGITTLPEAIQTLNVSQDADNLIVFQAGGVDLAGTITLQQALDAVNKNVTIDGKGLITVARDTTEGTPDFRVFKINIGKEVVLRGLTIEGGHLTGENGAGILNYGTLTLDGSTVRDNVADASGTSAGAGGGIMNDGGILNVINSYVWDNGAAGPGGGIANYEGQVSIIESTVSRNESTGQGASGGGIFSYSLLGNNQVTISNNSWITSNTTTGLGGGIFIWSVAGNATLTITDSVVFLNQASQGGGIAVGSHATATIQNTEIERNTGTSSGGGVYVDGGGSASLDATCVVADNTAPAGFGNGIYWLKSQGAVLVNMAQMVNNTADEG